MSHLQLARFAALVLVSSSLLGCPSTPTAPARDASGTDGGAPDSSVPADGGPGAMVVREVPCVGLPEYRHMSAVCSRVAVPLDPAAPGGERIELYTLRVPATAPEAERLGTLVVPSSGPGVPSATGYAVENLIAALPAELAARFDYLAWDERGTAESSRVSGRGAERLLRELGGYDSAEAADLALGPAARELAACWEASGALLGHLRPEDNAADLEALRVAFELERLTLWGVSYGTMVALRYAEAHPEHVRAVVVDGPFDPTLDLDRWVREQNRGRERYLNGFLEWCAEPGSGCAFAPEETTVEGKRAALAALRRQLIDMPTDGVQPLDLWLSIPLSSGYWDSWAFSLEQARGGRLRGLPTDEPFVYASGLADVGDSAFEYWDANGYLAVSCGLGSGWTADHLSRLRAELEGVFAADAAIEYYACSALRTPPRDSEPLALAYRGTPRVAVVWADNDPATPREWALALLDQLGDRGWSISLDAHVHGVALLGIPCVDDPVLAYLADPLATGASAVRCEP